MMWGLYQSREWSPESRFTGIIAQTKAAVIRRALNDWSEYEHSTKTLHKLTWRQAKRRYGLFAQRVIVRPADEVSDA